MGGRSAYAPLRIRGTRPREAEAAATSSYMGIVGVRGSWVTSPIGSVAPMGRPLAWASRRVRRRFVLCELTDRI